MKKIDMQKIVLITPPFTQISSPYAANPFLAGTLNNFNIPNSQIDLSLAVALDFFSAKGLNRLFDIIEKSNKKFPENIIRFTKRKEEYISTIDSVINFLQGKNNLTSYKIVTREYLPENSRFDILKNFSFKNEETVDFAKYLASLYIDDIYDLAKDSVLPNFGLSSYYERLGKSQPSFNEIDEVLQNEDLISQIVYENLSKYDFSKTTLVCITIPFPGNLISSLKISDWFKKNYPHIKIAIGGGYVSTELKFLTEPKIFKYVDFVCLDSGETPIISLIDFIEGKITKLALCRTFLCEDGKVIFYNDLDKKDICSKDLGIPDYKNLPIESYLTLYESTNKMHRLWSERVFLKLRMAYGCYHKKCEFCDTTLSYINEYRPINAIFLVDQIEQIIKDTKINSFHFVDEAMPPSVIKDFCIEILKRGLDIIWWGNIRFDRAFSYDLCFLMKKSGCIAVTGGMETANERILQLINKGISLNDTIQVLNNFSKNNILVHTYLIYGIPTETKEETVNSLEIVRQLFYHNLIKSAYYHRFALTIHSFIYNNPQKYNITIKDKKINKFANNDIEYIDNNKNNIDSISYGLNKAIYNFNYRKCLNDKIASWFDEKIPCNISKSFVADIIKNQDRKIKDDGFLLWTGNIPFIYKKNAPKGFCIFVIPQNKEDLEYEVPQKLGEWLCFVLFQSSIRYNKDFKKVKISDIEKTYPTNFQENFFDFLNNELWFDILNSGLLILV